jgi:hypothetical protein
MSWIREPIHWPVMQVVRPGTAVTSVLPFATHQHLKISTARGTYLGDIDVALLNKKGVPYDCLWCFWVEKEISDICRSMNIPIFRYTTVYYQLHPHASRRSGTHVTDFESESISNLSTSGQLCMRA